MVQASDGQNGLRTTMLAAVATGIWGTRMQTCRGEGWRQEKGFGVGGRCFGGRRALEGWSGEEVHGTHVALCGWQLSQWLAAAENGTLIPPAPGPLSPMAAAGT